MVKAAQQRQAPADDAADELASIERKLFAAKRLKKTREAADSLRAYIELNIPDPERPDDPDATLFDCEGHHALLIDFVEQVYTGKKMRGAVAIPPQHGKTTILTKYGVAWILGKFPSKKIIVGTYGDDYANKLGDDVREVLEGEVHKAVFPNCRLRKGARSKTELGTSRQGKIIFRGRGTATTGHPADLFIIDDPFKDEQEAKSPTIRDAVWNWYAAVVFTRCHNLTPIMICHTRWHEDDLLGRLVDPEHPAHNAEAAKKWVYRNIPAIVDDPNLAKALGMQPGGALWPQRFSLDHLAEARRQNPRVFSALYMGKPTPEDGDYFTADMIHPYLPRELPARLRFYSFSDHAVKDSKKADATVLLTVGIDDAGTIWLIDCWWQRRKTDAVVEAMIDSMEKHRAIEWCAEAGHISKAIGPFLKKRMRERNVHCYVNELQPSADKETRAQSIRGRMAMGGVRFPRSAWWFEAAKRELLKFPFGTNDDFVDALSLAGLRLDKQLGAAKAPAVSVRAPKVGTLAWVKWASEQNKRARNPALKGM